MDYTGLKIYSYMVMSSPAIIAFCYLIWYHIVKMNGWDKSKKIEWFYPLTTKCVKAFNESKKFTHLFSTFCCTIVGIVDTLAIPPSFILMSIVQIVVLIMDGIKSLIFVNPKEKEEETNNSIEQNLAFSYRTEHGTVKIYYDPKTHVKFYSLEKD